MLLLVLPLLVLLKETRRAACAALAVYIGVSLAFLFVPALNPSGDNWEHWSHIWQVSGMNHYLAAPSDVAFKVPGCVREIFSLPSFLNDLFPFRIPTFAYHLPLAAVLAFAVLAAGSRDAARRLTLTLVAAILGIEAYYLSYTVVWEYHYTTLLPTIPVLWWLYQAEKGGRSNSCEAPGGPFRQIGPVPFSPLGARCRCAAATAFWSSACVFLPTLYFLFQAAAESHQTLGKLVRVVPTVVAFASLLAYGAMVAASKRIGDLGLVGIGPTPRPWSLIANP